MNVFNKLHDNVSQAIFYVTFQKKEIKSYIGSVLNLTTMSKILGFISTINKVALFVLGKVKKVFDTLEIKEAIKGFTIAEGVISIISLIELKELYSDNKKFSQQIKEAVKTSEIAKTVLAGIGLLSQIAKVPIVIQEAFAPLVNLIGNIDLGELLQADKWAPSLGGISLVLSTAFTALKIGELYDTYKFANKMKEKCCLELIRNLEDDLKEEFKGNKPLLAKIDLALAFDKGKRLKKLHKKELTFQKELSKMNPDPEVLLKTLENVNVQDDKSQKMIEQLKATLSLYELNECLTKPAFKKDIQDKTSKLLGITYKEMKSHLKKGENVDIKELKKEIKKAAAQLNPEILNSINRSAKLAYLTILSEYNTKKLQSFYQIKGDQIQASTKKTVALANDLFSHQKFRSGDEKLTIAYKQLKGRVKHKSFSSKISLGLNTLSMASASIALAISVGSLATPFAPVGIALGILVSAVGLLNVFYNTYKSNKFQENMGITEMNLVKKMQKQFSELGDEHLFVKSLSTNQRVLFDLIKQKVKDEDFNTSILNLFAVPKIDRHSTDDERAVRLAAKQMNRLIKSMNHWSEKKVVIQEKLIAKQWSTQLKKIDPKILPGKSFRNLRLDLLHLLEEKKYDKMDAFKKIAIRDEWNVQQKAAVEQLNHLMDSMHDESDKRNRRRSDALKTPLNLQKTQLTQNSEIKQK